MKPWLVSLLVLLLLLAAAVASSFRISYSCQRWQQQLEEMALQARQEPRQILEPLEELAQQWQDAQGLLRLTSPHQELDEVQLQLMQCLRLCQWADGETVFHALLDLRDELRILQSTEEIRLKNIF